MADGSSADTRIAVEVAAPVLSDLDSRAAARQIEDGVAALRRDLGLDAGPIDVQVEVRADDGDEAIRVQVGGRRFRIPAYQFESFADLCSDVETLSGSAGAVADTTIALLRRWPGSLFGREDLAACSARLDAAGLRDDPTDLGAILTGLVDRGRSLAGSTALAAALNEQTADASPAERLEGVLARLDRPSATLIARGETLERLTRGTADRGPLRDMRERLGNLGIKCPRLRFAVDEELPPWSVCIRVNDVRTATRALPRSEDAVEADDALEALAGWLTLQLEIWAPWLIDEVTVREAYIAELAYEFPMLVALQGEALPESRVARVLCELVDEYVAIRNLPRILEALLEYDLVVADAARLAVIDERLPVRAPASDEWRLDPLTLATYVRIRLGGEIVDRLKHAGNLTAVGVSPELEDQLLDLTAAPTIGRSAASERLVTEVLRERGAHWENGQGPIVVCAPDARGWVVRALSEVVPRVPVVSSLEIPENVSLEVVGTAEAA